jgi:hypothetical protein
MEVQNVLCNTVEMSLLLCETLIFQLITRLSKWGGTFSLPFKRLFWVFEEMWQII